MCPNDPTRGTGPGERPHDPTPEDRSEDGPLTADLSQLYGDALPPPELEARVVADLRERGLLASAAPGRGSARTWLLRAAAGLVLFAAGWSARAAIAPTASPPAITGSEDYMVLVYGDASEAQSLDPAAVAAEYEAWGRGLAENGVGVTGNELAPDRTVLGEPDPAVGGSPLGGYFLLSVDSGRDVEALVQDHPHIRYGGWIEIAPVLRRN